MPDRDVLQAPFLWNSLSINLANVANMHHKDTHSTVLNVANHPAIDPPIAGEASGAVHVFTEVTPFFQRRFCEYFCGYRNY